MANYNRDEIQQELMRRGLLDQNGNITRQQQPQQSSLLSELTNSAPVNFAVGAGDATRDFLADTANLLPGVNIPKPRFGEGTSYNVGRAAGDIGSFLGGGELADLARGGVAAAKSPELLSQIASMLGGEGGAGIARRALGSGAYGAITNPEDRGQGAAEGVGLSALLDSAPYALGKIANSFTATPLMESIKQTLGNKATLGENARAAADTIKGSFDSAKSTGKDLYNAVFDKLGNSSLYDTADAVSQSPYQSIKKDVDKNLTSKLKKLSAEFEENPTLQNAHRLQSQFGSEARKLENAKDIASTLAKGSFEDAQAGLQNDITSYLSKTSPELAQGYQQATSNWAKNVIPYTSNKALADISKGRNVYPNLTSVFKRPNENIEKILQDNPDVINKIIYGELGNPAIRSPESFIRKADNLHKQGLGNYVGPELKSLLDALEKRVKNQQRIPFGLGKTLESPMYQSLSNAGNSLLPFLRALGISSLIPGGQ